ncbi:calcium/proton exchanger [Planctomyces sp. SH-PL62]|uniref:calcium/proton exchanger n=1 Tax=Planctomyces sp. SH-PL62 TaxID=1636152 RepID=UPI00078DDDDB|nr:calcium/proton exchanger [Planctomyces sp. SH-PL62]AMV36081.1 Putative cation exchanger YfkE [Planctomyces sp. SH-PL62]
MRQARVNQSGGGGGGGAGGAEAGSPWWDFLDPRGGNWLTILLLAVPVAVGLRFAGAGPIWLFAAACTAIIPLAGLMGKATEKLAERLGPGIGGLLNATFGNAAELIIAMFALFNGLDAVVKASITGSIIGNILLVMGASLLAGGLRFEVQRFNRTAAGVGATMLVLAAIGMLIPAMFHALPEVAAAGPLLEHELSVGVSIVLLLTYGAHLVFSLRTHKSLFNPEPSGASPQPEGDHGPYWSTTKSVAVLVGATLFIAWMSEILVGAVEGASHTLGMNAVFVGVIVVAIVGNAAEHSTAILMAMKNHMDLAVGIAIGSSLQIALFVAPVLVLASYLRAEPMDLLFTELEVLAVLVSVAIARMVAEDGESNWLEGLMLLMVYALLALVFFFLPGRTGSHPHGGGPEEAPPAAFAPSFGVPRPVVELPRLEPPTFAAHA